MKRILVFISALSFFLVANSALASPIVARDVSYTYTASVKENGGANVFLLVNNVGFGTGGGDYTLTLPEGATGDKAKAWYVDEGVYRKCIQPLGAETDAMYTPEYRCYETVRNWVEAEVVQEGDSVRITIPKTKGNVSLGITWAMSDVTEKTWWGRKVTVTTPVVDHFVSFVNVWVDFPDGLYMRDKAVGPSNWGDMTTGVMMSQPGAGIDEKMAFAPEIFDRIGSSADVVKNKNNLAPGESYSFTLLTATSRWKLFVPEIATMLAAAAALTIVVSLLLRLLIGKKPFGWYLAVTSLLVLFIILVVWLVRTYQTMFPETGIPYPAMMKSEAVPSFERIDQTTSP